MMIQLLTYNGNEEKLKGKDVTVNKIHDARSLDEFDINIIDLRDSNIWKYDGYDKGEINCINDLKSLSNMISARQKSEVIIIYPQNIVYLYENTYHSETRTYSLDNSCELKDMIDNMGYILSYIYESINNLEVLYENTRTRIADEEILAAFYFNKVLSEDVLTQSYLSDKPTTINYDSVILSTLDIKSYEQLINFLRKIHLIEEKEKVPDWIKEEKMFDDKEQLKIIDENNDIISKATNKIKQARKIMDRNERYKSILYTSGKELEDIVIEIIKEMLGCDLSQFYDEKKEDFNFILNDKVFIGEIKGIGTNVKSENISQLDVHVQTYLDDHEDDIGNIISLLIIDHQRSKPLSQREKVHNNQINLAKRNGSLIIETITLLKLFEKYLNHILTREKCIEILTTNTGLLTVDKFS